MRLLTRCCVTSDVEWDCLTWPQPSTSCWVSPHSPGQDTYMLEPNVREAAPVGDSHSFAKTEGVESIAWSGPKRVCLRFSRTNNCHQIRAYVDWEPPRSTHSGTNLQVPGTRCHRRRFTPRRILGNPTVSARDSPGTTRHSKVCGVAPAAGHFELGGVCLLTLCHPPTAAPRTKKQTDKTRNDTAAWAPHQILCRHLPVYSANCLKMMWCVPVLVCIFTCFPFGSQPSQKSMRTQPFHL